MLRLVEISKRYRRTEVLAGVSLSLEGGLLNVMVGPNGSGKSTLLRILAGMEEPTAGRFTVGGSVPSWESIGYLPQAVRFHPLVRVEAVVAFYARAAGLSHECALAALVRWGLCEHRRKRTHELSGGLRQRLGLAVLGLTPKIMLLLDEPDLSLDHEWRTALRGWLQESASRGTLVIVTTHLAEEWKGVVQQWLHCGEAGVSVRSVSDHDTSSRERLGGGR